MPAYRLRACSRRVPRPALLDEPGLPRPEGGGQGWLAEHHRCPGRCPRFRAKREVPPLSVFAAVTGSDADETDQALDPTSVEAAIDARGVVHLSSGGRASDLLRGRVLIEMYNAQLIGTWRRLKVCHN